MNYSVEIDRDDCIKACKNYLIHARHKANKRRISEIKELTTDKVGKVFFGLMSRFYPAKFSSVKDAIRYMKKEQADYFGYITMWDYCAIPGGRIRSHVEDLLSEIESKKIIGNVVLYDNMAFLTKWVDVDFRRK